MAPKEQQAKIAFDRLKEAVAKVEEGFNVPLEERTTLNTVGDLINLLNLARVATEETVQKAIRDLDKTITFHAFFSRLVKLMDCLYIFCRSLI